MSAAQSRVDAGARSIHHDLQQRRHGGSGGLLRPRYRLAECVPPGFPIGLVELGTFIHAISVGALMPTPLAAYSMLRCVGRASIAASFLHSNLVLCPFTVNHVIRCIDLKWVRSHYCG
jgi:hypothetical protein